MNAIRTGYKIYIIGISAQELDRFPLNVLETSILVVAGKAMLPVLQKLQPSADPSRFQAITPLAEALMAIGKKIEEGDVVVVASGDPLFFGVGEILVKNFGKERITFHPAVSSMQLLFSRLAISWHDALFISLHGRKTQVPFSRMLSAGKVCVLTDREHNPSWLALELLRTIPPEKHHLFTMSVGVALGSPGEQVIIGNLEEIASRNYADPNIVLLCNDLSIENNHPILGLRENEIEHSRGLITKNEVRAAILHNLRLPRTGVFWDSGAGSGSISIEISQLNREIAIFAIEKDLKQLAHITANKRHFCAWNIEIVAGETPAALLPLPAPDRVFIGGSGGRLAETVAVVVDRLRQGGRVLIAAVLDTTREQAPKLLHRHGCAVEVITLSVERMTYPDRQHTSLNPITLVIGQK